MSSQVIPLSQLLEGPSLAPAWNAEQAAMVAFDPDPEFFTEWDYERRRLTQWKRLGECNGCGDCCRAEIAVRTTGPSSGNWYGDSTTGRGVWFGAQSLDGLKHFYAQTVKIGEANGQAACKAHCAEGCAIYDRRPTLCHVWPAAPAQAKAYPRCSYTFERGDVWELKADWSVGEEIPSKQLIEVGLPDSFKESGA